MIQSYIFRVQFSSRVYGRVYSSSLQIMIMGSYLASRVEGHLSCLSVRVVFMSQV